MVICKKYIPSKDRTNFASHVLVHKYFSYVSRNRLILNNDVRWWNLGGWRLTKYDKVWSKGMCETELIVMQREVHNIPTIIIGVLCLLCLSLTTKLAVIVTCPFVVQLSN